MRHLDTKFDETSKDLHIGILIQNYIKIFIVIVRDILLGISCKICHSLRRLFSIVYSSFGAKSAVLVKRNQNEVAYVPQYIY